MLQESRAVPKAIYRIRFFRYARVLGGPSMPRVSFTPNLQRHLSCPTRDVVGITVREALDSVFADNPVLRTYVLDDQNRLRKHVAVFVGGKAITDRTTLTDVVPADGEIYVMQALSGG
jgi:hypothetical protein